MTVSAGVVTVSDCSAMVAEFLMATELIRSAGGKSRNNFTLLFCDKNGFTILFTVPA
jgi:hypothetical protein